MDNGEEMRLFDDLPLFEQGGVEQANEREERFGHWAYARTLGKILKQNDKPLNVGLFGEWGTGKTTVINMLIGELEQKKDNRICAVVFNAWRHQGDSFRRQLLLSVAEKMYGGNSQEYMDMTSLVGLSECISEAKEEDGDATEKATFREVFGELLKVWNWIFRSNEKAAMLVRTAVVFYTILLAVGIFVAWFWKPELATFVSTGLLLPVVLVLFGAIEKSTKHKLIATLHINQPRAEKPRLSYPEQFELEFIKCLGVIKKREERLVVVVDDLDRCDKDSVVAALAVVKQFAGKSNCVFIIPCDENQVMEAVNSAAGNHNYNYESLRKFFDVAVRMDKIPEADLHGYAKYLVDEWKLAPRLAELAVYSGARDARKVKAFLNSFKTRYAIIKEREPKYFAEGTAERNLELIAKLTALEDGFPEFYKKLCGDPAILGKVERSQRMSLPQDLDVNGEGLEVNVDEVCANNAALKRFLRYTADINLAEISDIIAGKRPEVIAGISTGSDMLAALTDGNVEKFVDAIKGLTDEESGKVVDYVKQQVRDYEEHGLTASLRMLVGCILGVFRSPGIWEDKSLETTKQSLADVVVETIQRDASLVKESGDIEGVESIFKTTSQHKNLANAIVQVYTKEPTAPEGAIYLALINRQSTYFKSHAENLNSVVAKALATEKEIEILKQMANSKLVATSREIVPSSEVIDVVVNRLESKDEAYDANRMRGEVICNYPERIAWNGFVKKWSELTKTAQTSSISVEKTNLDVGLQILDSVAKIEEEDGDDICLKLLQIWAHNGEELARKRVLVTLVNVYPISKGDVLKKVRTAVFDWLSTRPVEEIVKALEQLTEAKEPLNREKRESLSKWAAELLGKFVEWMKTQVNAYNERVEQIVGLISKWNLTLNDETKLMDLVVTIITKANDNSFEAWHKKSLGTLCDCLGKEALQNMGIVIIESVENAQTTKARRSLLLSTLITKGTPRQLEGNETDRIFRLLWHDDSNMRDPICEKFESLKPKFKDGDFSRNIGIIAREIANSSAEKIREKASSVTTFLRYAHNLRKGEKEQVLSAVPSLIHSTNPKESIAVGLEILETLGAKDEIPQDVLSGLETLRKNSDVNLKQRAVDLLQKFGKEEKEPKKERKPKKEEKSEPEGKG